MPAVTDDLLQLLYRLETDTTLQRSFVANAAAATRPFALTSHERDAIVTRDCDDFIALGLVSSIWELPEVLTGPRPPRFLRAWLRLRLLLSRLLRLPPPVGPIPEPRPRPDPGPLPDPPRPRPGPRPGPDPPPGG
jgi:hypothetical protein